MSKTRLSPREIQVITLASQGHGQKAIAGILGIARNTVQTHTVGAYDKLGASSIARAVFLAIQEGYLKCPLNPPHL